MPLVTLSVERVGAGPAALVVSQHPTVAKFEPQLWWVPLHVRISPPQGPPATLFAELGPQTASARFPLPAGADPGGFLQGNYNFSAFLLVNYSDPRHWAHLADEMARPDFPAIDRQQLQKQLTYLAKLEGPAGPSVWHLTAFHRGFRERALQPPAAGGAAADGAAVLAFVRGVVWMLRQLPARHSAPPPFAAFAAEGAAALRAAAAASPAGGAPHAEALYWAAWAAHAALSDGAGDWRRYEAWAAERPAERRSFASPA